MVWYREMETVVRRTVNNNTLTHSLGRWRSGPPGQLSSPSRTIAAMRVQAFAIDRTRGTRAMAKT